MRVPSSSPPPKELYNPKTFFTHAALLDQGCPHCPIFPTAASRRSLGRVSVPVWLIVLSDQLPIAGLVGLYPTNYLIGRRLLPRRIAALALRPHAVLAPVSQGCPPPQDTFLRVTHPSAAASYPAARLACVKHAASVRSEPGSNSQVHRTAAQRPQRPTRELIHNPPSHRHPAIPTRPPGTKIPHGKTPTQGPQTPGSAARASHSPSQQTRQTAEHAPQNPTTQPSHTQEQPNSNALSNALPKPDALVKEQLPRGRPKARRPGPTG